MSTPGEPTPPAGESGGEHRGAQPVRRASKRVGRPFDSASARAAALQANVVKRERIRQRDEARERAGLTTRQRAADMLAQKLTDEQLGAIIDAALQDAKSSGDSMARSRGVRDLLAIQAESLGRLRPQEEEQPHDASTPWEELSEAERAALRASWRREQASPAEQPTDPRSEPASEQPGSTLD